MSASNSIATITRRQAVALAGATLAAAGIANALAKSGFAQENSEGATSEASDSAGALFANPGTYTATAPGRNDDITLTLTVSSDAIEDITVDSRETWTIGRVAMQDMADWVIANQSTAVDIVTGATYSSAAFTMALGDAIEQAGGNTDVLGASVEAEPIDYVTEADLVIVGAGGAGLTAAVKALNDGASVIVIDKQGIVGGNTNCAATGPNVAGSKVQDELFAAYAAAQSQGGDGQGDGDGQQGDGQGDQGHQQEPLVEPTVDDFRAAQLEDEKARPELVDALVDNSGEMIDWYHNVMGIEFELDDHNASVVQAKNTSGLDGHDAPHTGNLLIEADHAALNSSDDAHIYTNLTATELVLDASGRVTGVKATDADGNEITFTGKAVIVSTGGFGYNSELIAQVNPDKANCGYDGAAHVMGDGITMAEALGAQAVDMGELENSGYNCVARDINTYVGDADISFDMEKHRSLRAGIFVNTEGKRFVSEADYTAEDILAQTDGAIYHIFPASMVQEGGTAAHLLELGLGFQESDPTALAEDLGIDADSFAQTIADWNASVAAGSDQEFGRTDEGVVALDGEIFGYLFKNTIHYCMGGILIDGQAHALDENGDPIPGLYMAGETTGGVHGGTRRDGSGIADSLTFGYIAGREAAAEVLA